ncbi:helix-turn-helix domain-containing protein [Candidatus Frankia alpina]|uniref:Helix-turn-helix domain-containing protein n=1 Tax=Candidatus Frankia alpina TaxID=2699483 RepID=A0A4S5ETA7_9ACTN|nr:helix-turn-helix domain-containing protein [Candidatus Frankia alpina]THJ75382.1 hypothetical protein E7Y31_05790 [Candidatus Frankia alpina]
MTGEPVEGAVGRRAPFTQVGDWVVLASISMQAKTIYWMLSAHVKRRDRAAWPSRESLAEWCGFGQARSVDRYLAELVDLGAIEIYRTRSADGLRTRNRYTVQEYPPDGYQGLMSFDAYHRAQQAPTDEAAPVEPDDVQAADPDDARGAPQRTTAPPARTRKTAGQPVVRSSAPR